VVAAGFRGDRTLVIRAYTRDTVAEVHLPRPPRSLSTYARLPGALVLDAVTLPFQAGIFGLLSRIEP
jgi:hypothetical protein